VFLQLSPVDQPGEHLAALAAVARIVGSAERLAVLRSASTDADLAAALGAHLEPSAGVPA
jgi:hypothetical protein